MFGSVGLLCCLRQIVSDESFEMLANLLTKWIGMLLGICFRLVVFNSIVDCLHGEKCSHVVSLVVRKCIANKFAVCIR